VARIHARLSAILVTTFAAARQAYAEIRQELLPVVILAGRNLR